MKNIATTLAELSSSGNLATVTPRPPRRGRQFPAAAFMRVMTSMRAVAAAFRAPPRPHDPEALAGDPVVAGQVSGLRLAAQAMRQANTTRRDELRRGDADKATLPARSFDRLDRANEELRTTCTIMSRIIARQAAQKHEAMELLRDVERTIRYRRPSKKQRRVLAAQCARVAKVLEPEDERRNRAADAAVLRRAMEG